MIVKVLVTANIEVVAGEAPADDKLRAAVCEAIDNAVKLGADIGFEHPLSTTTSIAIQSTELVDEDPLCYFRCASCNRLDTASTDDVKAVGHPVCCDEEMAEIEAADYRDLEEEEESCLSWVEAAANIPAGDIWTPRIIYDQRPDGWYWRDAASDDAWNGPFGDREAAAKAACEANDFHPTVTTPQA